MFGSERREEVEGKRIKQKHDEKKKPAEKSHQTTEFEIALCQLGLLFLISHYVAGLFGDGCLSAAVTGIAMIAVLLFAQRETQEDILQYYRRSRGEGASDHHAEVHLSSVPVLLGCRSFGPLRAHCLSDMMAIVGRCCVQGCVAAQLVLSVEEAGRECEVTDRDPWTHPSVIAEVRLTPGPAHARSAQTLGFLKPNFIPKKKILILIPTNGATKTISVETKVKRCNAHARAAGGDITPKQEDHLANHKAGKTAT